MRQVRVPCIQGPVAVRPPPHPSPGQIHPFALLCHLGASPGGHQSCLSVVARLPMYRGCKNPQLPGRSRSYGLQGSMRWLKMGVAGHRLLAQDEMTVSSGIEKGRGWTASGELEIS